MPQRCRARRGRRSQSLLPLPLTQFPLRLFARLLLRLGRFSPGATAGFAHGSILRGKGALHSRSRTASASALT